MIKKLVIAMLIGLSFPAFSADIRYELRVDGLACPYCAYGVEKKIKALDGVDKGSIEIKLNEGLVVFKANTEPPLTEGFLTKLINDAGFTLRGLKTQALSSLERVNKTSPERDQ